MTDSESAPRIERVVATEAAAALIARLRQQHGTVFFYQSHGCCEGSTPMCFAPGELGLTTDDVQLGSVAGVPFWASHHQSDYLMGLQLTLDAVPGSGGTFSLEEGSGLHFVVHLRLWTDAEAQALQAQSTTSTTATTQA
jgi:uncharacterized protein (DUF779 family)